MESFESFGSSVPTSPPQTISTRGASAPPANSGNPARSDSPSPADRLEFKTSAATEALDEALAKAQGEIEHASKDATNPHFGKTYADLASVWNACREALSKNSIAVTQWPVPPSKANTMAIVTRLAHKGQWMQSGLELPVAKADAQGAGAALTYLRRYALSAAVGVAPNDDDDGNSAAGRGTQPFGDLPDPKPRAATKPPAGTTGKPAEGKATISSGLGGPRVTPKSDAVEKLGEQLDMVTSAQLKRLFAIRDEAAPEKRWTDDQMKMYLEQKYRIGSTKALTRSQYDELVETIQTKAYGPAFAAAIGGNQA